MRIPFSTIIDYISDLDWAYVQKTNDNGALSFEDVSLTYPGQTDFDPHTLYILNHDLTGHEGEFCTFLSPDPDHTFPADCNLVTLETNDTPEQLCHQINKFLITLRNWAEQLDLAIIEDCSLQTLLDISDPIIKNPMLLLDNSFNCLACSASITEADDFYYDVKIHGRPSAETVFALKQNSMSRRFTYGRFLSQKSYRISMGPTHDQELFSDFLSDESFGMGLNLRFSRVPFSPGQIDLIGIFVEKLQLYYNKRMNSEKNTGEISFKEFLFPLLLRGDPQAVELAKGFSPFQNTYMILTTNSNMTRALANEIKDSFTDSYLFSFDQIYYIFVPAEIYEEESPCFIHKIEKQLSEIGRRYSVTFGVSGPVSGHKWLRMACEQALRSIESSDCSIIEEDEIPFVKRYRMIALPDMLSSYFKEHPLQSFAPLNYLAIRRDDEANETDHCSFIKTYILNGCNSARTSKEIFLHKNTINYRIEKLKERYHFNFDSTYENLMFLLSYISDHTAE